MTSVNFMGIAHKHTDGVHTTSFRCICLDEANLAVEVKDGQVLRAFCLACERENFTVLVEGKDLFWPVHNSHVIG